MSTKEQLTEEQKLAQFQALVSGNIDEVEDLPEYAVFGAGSYSMRGAAGKLNLEKGAVQMTFEKLELVEKADGTTDEEVPADGALLGSNFYGKFGVQKFKKLFSPHMATLGVSSVEQFLDQFENTSWVVIVTKRADKDDPKKFYNDIAAIALAP